jgi:hypothetical protein
MRGGGGPTSVQPKPGASYAISGPNYISPFVIKIHGREDAQRKYIDGLFSPGHYDGFQHEYSRRRDRETDRADLHLQWTRERAKYATSGDLGDLLRMLDFVTETNPPEKTPAEIAALQPKPDSRRRLSLFSSRGGRAS